MGSVGGSDESQRCPPLAHGPPARCWRRRPASGGPRPRGAPAPRPVGGHPRCGRQPDPLGYLPSAHRSNDGGVPAGAAIGPTRRLGGTPVPWVDERDLTRLLVHLAETESSGSFNLVGPASPPFSEFADAVQAIIGHRSWLGLPAPVVRAVLGKHAAELVLARYQVRPDRALASGFVFEHTDLRRSIQEALNR